MEIKKSRSGFYTVTFFNKNQLDEKKIFEEFSSVGNVYKIIQHSNRVFIRYKEREEAERAIQKFRRLYDVEMAKNKSSENHQHEEKLNHNHEPSNDNNHKPSSNHNPTLSSPGSSTQRMEKLITTDKVFHLILGNLPENYTIKDVRALVEEAKPVCINQIEKTIAFKIRFCDIVLDSAESVDYLIEKLNGFVISGEKLIAAEAKHLIDWRQKSI